MKQSPRLVVFCDQTEESQFNLKGLNRSFGDQATIIYLNPWDEKIKLSHEEYFPDCKIIYLSEIAKITELFDLSDIQLDFDMRHCQENAGLLHGRFYNNYKIDETTLSTYVKAVISYIDKTESNSILLFLGKQGEVRSLVYDILINRHKKVYSVSYCLIKDLILLTHDHKNCVEFFGINGTLQLLKEDEFTDTVQVISQRDLENEKNLKRRSLFSTVIISIKNNIRSLIFGFLNAINENRWKHAFYILKSYSLWICYTIWLNINISNFHKKFNKINEKYEKVSLIFLHVFPEATTFDEFLEYPSELFYLREYGLFNVSKASIFIDHPYMRLNGERPSSMKAIYKSLPNSYYFDAPSLKGFPLALLDKVNEVHTLCGSVALEASEYNTKVNIYARHPLELIKNIVSNYKGIKFYKESYKDHIGTLSLNMYKNAMIHNAVKYTDLQELIDKVRNHSTN